MRHQRRIVQIGGTAAWLAVGSYVVLQGADDAARLATWSVAFAAFGIGLLFSAFRERPSLPMLVVQVAAITTMVLLLCNGYEGTLLVIVAMQLGGLFQRRQAMLWIIVRRCCSPQRWRFTGRRARRCSSRRRTSGFSSSPSSPSTPWPARPHRAKSSRQRMRSCERCRTSSPTAAASPNACASRASFTTPSAII